MMKRTRIFISLAIALTASVSCTREEVPEKYSDIHFTITAGQDVGPETKVYDLGYSNGRTRLHFEYNDRIFVWSPDAIQVSSSGVLYTNPGLSCRNLWNIPEPVSNNLPLYWGEASTHAFYGKYPDPTWTSSVPYTEHEAFGKQAPKSDKFLCWLPGTFTAANRFNEMDTGYCYMTAYTSVSKAETVNLDFVPAFSTFKINIRHSFPGGLAVKSVKLSSASHRLNGEYTVNIGPTTTYTVPESYIYNDDKKVSVEYTSPVTFYPTGAFSVTLLTCPVTVADLTVTIDTTEGAFTMPLKSNGEWISFPAGYFYEITFSDLIHDDPVFSVAENRHVCFSPGNLEYRKWRPSEEQWVFTIPQYKGISYWGVYENYDYNQGLEPVQHFGWGTSGHDGVYPYLTSDNESDYGSALSAGEFPREWDWGVNTIYNGAGYTWRTPTIAEWDYLFGRKDAQDSLLFASAKVDNTVGLILFPDNFVYPDFEDPNSVIKACGMCSPSANVITASTWDRLESQGCVFLPAYGGRTSLYYSEGIRYVEATGVSDKWICWYWSSTTDDTGPLFWTYQHYVNNEQYDRMLLHQTSTSRTPGYAVRLVRDVN